MSLCWVSQSSPQCTFTNGAPPGHNAFILNLFMWERAVCMLSVGKLPFAWVPSFVSSLVNISDLTE